MSELWATPSKVKKLDRRGVGPLRKKRPPGPGAFSAGKYKSQASQRLKKLRQGSILAISLTGMLLLMMGQGTTTAQHTEEGQVVVTNAPLVKETGESIEEATHTVRELFTGAYAFLPKLLIALIIFVLASLLGRVLKKLLEKFLGKWARTQALIAISRIGLYLAAAIAAMTVVAGDVRALLGSIGLVGLALSWALQTPIESFTGWLLNSLRGYYYVGDRIAVGEVFGDVYKIDVLTTTVWEAGGPGKAVAGAQATGAMITFPNWEVLRSNITNYSRDFPYVWDEITISLSNETDLAYAMEVVQKTARKVLGDVMAEPTEHYKQLLERARLSFDVEEEPGVYFSAAESWFNCTVRYLVPARTRRRWATTVLVAINEEISRPEHREKIFTGYPRTEVVLQASQGDHPKA